MTAAAVAAATAVLLALFAAVAWERARAFDLPLSFARFSAIAPGAGAIGLSGWLATRDSAAYASAVLLACAAVSATTDLQTGYIFDRVLLAGTLLALAPACAGGRLADAAAGGLLASALLMIPYACSRGRGIGLGDVKFAATIGFGLGTAGALSALWFAAVCGGTVAIVLLAAGRVARGGALPFGPFLAIGASYAIVRLA
ncbi:MAG TPA: A24 family peptidase [Candidatus Tumulicola sp.]